MFEFRQVRWNILGNLGSHLRLEFFDKRVVYFATGSEVTALDLGVAGQCIKPLGQLTYESFTCFQFDIMPLTIRHCAPVLQAGSPREAPGKVGDSIHQASMGIRIFELLNKFEPGRTVHRTIFQFERFESSKISDHQQRILHNYASVKPGDLRPDFLSIEE